MAIGRPIQFNPDEAVGAAMRAFWAKGYEATSLHDLLEATSLSKSSLYQAFGGKKQLFGRCIESYTDQMVAMLRDRLGTSPTALDFIKGILTDIATEGAHTRSPQGCLLMNTASEFGQRDPHFVEWVNVGIGRIRTVFELAVRRAQTQGDVSKGRSAAAIADYLMTSIAGLRTMVKAGTPPKTLRGVVGAVLETLV